MCINGEVTEHLDVFKWWECLQHVLTSSVTKTSLSLLEHVHTAAISCDITPKFGSSPTCWGRESDKLLMFSTNKDAFKTSLTAEKVDETANDVKLNSRRKPAWKGKSDFTGSVEDAVRHRGTTRTRSHTREWFCECCLVSPACVCWDLIQSELRRLPEVTCHWFSRRGAAAAAVWLIRWLRWCNVQGGKPDRTSDSVYRGGFSQC